MLPRVFTNKKKKKKKKNQFLDNYLPDIDPNKLKVFEINTYTEHKILLE